MKKSAARLNLANEANADMSVLYARGAFKLVYRGTYSKGERSGDPCVCKMFASGSVYEEAFFDTELAVTTAAMDLVTKYNSGGFIDRHIYLNQPAVWTFLAGTEYEGQKILVEPFIQNFQKFNSNSGWRDPDGTPWNQVLQSLSHYSYHVSGGSLLLCDLQGGVYSDGVVLTDPVVMSSNAGRYGPTDLGRAGIATFFARHVCNAYCRTGWTKPHNPQASYPAQKGTTMELVPTRDTRSPLTHHYY